MGIYTWLFVVDTERHIYDTTHSSRSFLEKCFVSLAIFKALTLKE